MIHMISSKFSIKHSLQKINDPLFGPANDCLVSTEKDGALEQLFVFEQNFDHSLRIVDEVIRIEFEFLEHRILAHKVLDRILESLDHFLQLLTTRRGLDI